MNASSLILGIFERKCKNSLKMAQ